MKKSYLVTAALPYANGHQHLGHLAGNFLPADIYVRFLRLMGKDVLWVCGSDEHGAAITLRAKKENLSPQDIIDKYHFLNKETFADLGLSFDIYHRTSDPIHHQTSQDFFKTLYEKGGEFEERTTEQFFDEQFQQFLADRYIIGECPKCNFPDAYGDQCERCGSTLSPSELINPRSILSGEKPILKLTKHWFFKLDKHAEWIRTWLADGTLDGEFHHNPNDWRKHVLGQCLSWIEGGLLPRSITRDLDWGVQVPLKEAAGKVLYVWFDAPIGYISATKAWASEHHKDWRDYWQNPDCELVHFLGKDNIVFHCIIFPAMLKAHGKFNLPTNVPANQFLNFEGQKFSKSRGWGITLDEYLHEFKDFPNAVDALRFALVRTMPENKDSDFKWDEFIAYHDKDLADNLGNFANRVMVLTHKYFNGTVPSAHFSLLSPELESALRRFVEELQHFNFKNAMDELIGISTYGNTYLQDVSPWKIWKDAPESDEIKTCLRHCLDVLYVLSVLTKPFIPFTSDRIRAMLQLQPVQNGDLAKLISQVAEGESLYQEGHQVGEPVILFAKIQDRNDQSRLAIVQKQKDKLLAILQEEQSSQIQYEPLKPSIEYDDFAKMDIRTGIITAAKKVEKADKLLCLSVDLGFETRTIVSGIAQHFQPEAIIGKRVLVLANLAPRKLRGIESQGMILMAENEAGKLEFVETATPFEGGFTVK